MLIQGFLRLAAAAGVALCLASCGGGGGGGGGGGNSGAGSGGGTTTSGPGGISVTADKSAIKFIGFTNQFIAPQSVNFTLNGGSGTYYGQVILDRAGTFTATFNITSDNSAVVTITPTGAVQSNFSGKFQFQLCTDSACGNVAWSDTIPYSVDVFSVSPNGINATGYEGAALPAQTIAVSPADTSNQLSVSVNLPNSPTNWLTASHGSDGSLQIGISGAGLNAGSYEGYVDVTFAGVTNAPVLAIPVAFTVGDGIVAPAASIIDLTANASSASLSGSMPVTFNGTQNPAWTASSDSAWLVLGKASGTGAGVIQYTIDPTKLGAVADWSAVTGNVTISAPGMTNASVPVTVNLKLPEIYSVSPGTVPAGRAATVTISGRGLAQLSGVNQISLAGVPVASGTITSDTGAVLSLPALAAGRSTLVVPNAAGIPAASSAVGAASLNTSSYSFTPNTGEIGDGVYDPVRAAFYVENTTQNTLMRYRLSGGQWQIASLPIAGIDHMVMAPDGHALYVGSGTNQLLSVDPDAMTVTATYTPSILLEYDSLAGGLAVTNNGRIWFGGGGYANGIYFDMAHNLFGRDAFFATPYSAFFPSGDGSVMIIVELGVSPQDPYSLYNASTDTVTTSVSPPQLYAPLLNRDGSEYLDVETELLHNTSTNDVLGSIAVGTGIGTDAVISPDGTRIYQLATASTENLIVDHVNVYDTTQLAPGATTLPQVGQIAVTDQATSCPPDYPYGCNPVGRLSISPLGDTLFWVGNQGLVVLPIPSTMSNVKQAAPRILRAMGH